MNFQVSELCQESARNDSSGEKTSEGGRSRRRIEQHKTNVLVGLANSKKAVLVCIKLASVAVFLTAERERERERLRTN